jgi:hypothetical protein
MPTQEVLISGLSINEDASNLDEALGYIRKVLTLSDAALKIGGPPRLGMLIYNQ